MCEKRSFQVMSVWYSIQHFFSRLPWFFVQIYPEKQPSQTMLPNCLNLLKADCRTEVYHRVSVKLKHCRAADCLTFYCASVNPNP